MDLVTPRAALRLAAALATRPVTVLSRGATLVAQLGEVGLGTSTLAPHHGDERFARTDWLNDPLRRRVMQAYLATTGAATGLIDDVAGPDLPPDDEARLREVVAAVADTVCPAGPVQHLCSTLDANSGRGTPGSAPRSPVRRRDRPDQDVSPGPVGDLRQPPQPLAATPGRNRSDAPGRENGSAPGRGVAAPSRGVGATPGGDPAVAPGGHLMPGRDVAATPGAVVLRTPMFELLQYLPRTDQVYDVPVLLVGPLVHRYYLADLVPGHSLVEHLVDAGLQVFALSWPDPGPDAAGRDLDTYAAAVLDAVEACGRVTRCPRVTLAGLRTGGLLTAAVQSHLAAIGRADRVGAAVYLGTVLDQHAALPGFRLDTGAARAAGQDAGVLDGQAALRSWTWRRGGEQVRPYAVGPAAADRLPTGPLRRALEHWAGDLLHLPTALHADLVALAAADPERPPATVLGTPVEPHRLGSDAYLVTAAEDPAQPWAAGHRTAELLGGSCRLVRAPGDQAGAVLGAPDGFRAGPVTPGQEPEDWAAAVPELPGSWWPDLAGWLAERSGTVRDAPPELGGRRMHPVHPAPGTYLN